jgi:small subunit ribosomal protein S20
MATASKAKKKTVRIASGLKRVRQDTKLNAANTAMRSHFRTVIKNVQKAVDSGDKAKAAELFKAAQPVIDSVADKGLFHKNKAARHKSRLSAKVKALATAERPAPRRRLRCGPFRAGSRCPAAGCDLDQARGRSRLYTEPPMLRRRHRSAPRSSRCCPCCSRSWRGPVCRPPQA